MKGKKIGSFAAIAWLVSVAMVLVWGVSMVCATWVQADSYYWLLRRTQPKDREEMISWCVSEITARYAQDGEGSREEAHWSKDHAVAFMTTCANMTDYFILADVHMQSMTGMLIVDSEGEQVVQNRDILYCNYVSEETWHKGSSQPDGNAWIDLEKEPKLKAALTQIEDQYGLFGFDRLRVMGYFEGDELIPLKVEHGMYVGSGFQGVKEFVTLYEVKDRTGRDLVTVYTEHNEIRMFTEDAPVRYHGKRYNNAVELLKAVGKAEDQESLVELIEFKSMKLQAPDEYGKEETFTVLLAIVHFPLLAAMEKLVPVYIGTFVMAAALVLAVLLILHKNLFHPLTVLDRGFFELVRSRPSWAEPEWLAMQMEEMDGKIKERNNQLRKQDNEISRLNQSIEYAAMAEENRKQLVSGVAHELKTPLAIISGYTEGLQEHIAEEKREEYLDIILSETRRMDGLVMEMLELSRLEAGKITLARDEFDLSAMVRDVCEKLSREAEQKGLRVELELRLDAPVYADEGRMEQIVRNLVANAVRYTPEGGRIRVYTERLLGNVEFRIYNDAKHFTEDERKKVWEVFYRTDNARHGKGTGLGLAITKNLVQLHGGSCGVSNVPGGVEFSFRIPQKY